MNIIQVDDSGLLFISPAITDWESVAARGIDVVIDMEGGLDDYIPTAPDSCLYVYFPIYDEDLLGDELEPPEPSIPAGESEAPVAPAVPRDEAEDRKSVV